MSDQLVMNHSPDLPRISLFFPVLSTISTQICHDICEEEMPGFEYFGTQWSVEVRAPSRSETTAVQFIAALWHS